MTLQLLYNVLPSRRMHTAAAKLIRTGIFPKPEQGTSRHLLDQIEDSKVRLGSSPHELHDAIRS